MMIVRRGLIPSVALALTCAASVRAADSKDCAPAKVATLVRGAPLHGANGLRFDAAGRLNIGSVFGREIVVMDPDSGKILDRFTHADGVETPDDLVFGPDGSLYWTAIGSGQVGKRTPAGKVTTVAQLPVGVNPITFSPDGRLFVGSCFFSTGLYEVDPNGLIPPRLIRDFPGERCGVNAFDVGADGLLYAPRFFNSEVVSIDVESGSTQSVIGRLSVPSAAKFDRQGRLNVVDMGRGELLRVDVATGHSELAAKIPRNTDNLAFDAQGRLFISGADDGSIHEVRRDGSLREVSPGGLSFPGGVAIVGDRLFVADHYEFVEFDTAGRQLSRETSIIGVSELAEPMTVSVVGSNLVVSSWLANAVQIWDPRKHQVLETFNDFEVPIDAVGFEGGLAVSQLGTGSVVLEKGGQRSTVLDQLAVPSGLVADGTTLYVADWALGTITQVTPNGSNVIARNLANPEGLALTPDHDVLVVESGAGRVSQLDPRTGDISVLAQGLHLGLAGVPGFSPTYAFCGIALDDAGNAYVAGDVDNVIYLISRAAHASHSAH